MNEPNDTSAEQELADFENALNKTTASVKALAEFFETNKELIATFSNETIDKMLDDVVGIQTQIENVYEEIGLDKS